MNGSTRWTGAAKIVGWSMLAVGISVFAIRLQHAGPYELPEKGNLRAGLLALALGGALLALGFRRAASRSLPTLLLLIAAPIVLFFALYATLAEFEEVVVLRATNSSGEPSNLRLWVVDHEGTAWVSMPRSKHDEHALDGTRVEMLRAGETTCVKAVLSSDPEENERTFRLRDEKYAVQRFGRLIGLFGAGPSPNTVTLRLDRCT
jgi:uncharacterized membrane protein YiaA